MPGYLEEPELPQQLSSAAHDAHNVPQKILTGAHDDPPPVHPQLQQLLWDVQALAGRAQARAGASAALAEMLYETSSVPQNAAAGMSMRPAQREQWNRCWDLQLLASSMHSFALTQSAA